MSSDGGARPAGSPDGGSPGSGRLERATDLLRAERPPDAGPSVASALASARLRRRSRHLDVVPSSPGSGRVRVAGHVLADAVRAAADGLTGVVVTGVDVRREGAACTGLVVRCAAVYGTDVVAAGHLVRQVAVDAARDVLGPGTIGPHDVDVQVDDVISPGA